MPKAKAHLIKLKIRSQQKGGVLFDVGHGQGAFDWKVAEAAAQRGFWPDLISTDLHSGNVSRDAKDLCYVMTKLRAVGMPLHKVFHLHKSTETTASIHPSLFLGHRGRDQKSSSGHRSGRRFRMLECRPRGRCHGTKSGVS